jgi:hypothetical protein
MTEYYKGQRVSELLDQIAEMEVRLKLMTSNAEHQPFSMAQYEEVAQGYSTLALAKAKFKAIQGEK